MTHDLDSHATPTDAFVSPRIRTEESSARYLALHEGRWSCPLSTSLAAATPLLTHRKGSTRAYELFPLPSHYLDQSNTQPYLRADSRICEIALGEHPMRPLPASTIIGGQCSPNWRQRRAAA